MKPSDTPSHRDEVAKLLSKAATVIQKRGLAKSERISRGGAMCVHGALAYVETGDANGNSQLEADAAKRIYKVLTKLEREDCEPYGVAQWSNRSTKKEVVAKLRIAAKVKP